MKPTSVAKPTQHAALAQDAGVKPETMEGDEKYQASRKEAKEKEELMQVMKLSK